MTGSAKQSTFLIVPPLDCFIAAHTPSVPAFAAA